MQTSPFFSIVIPTYNRGKLINKSIKSVLSQKFTDFELIIIDDGSSDNTQEVISLISDPRLTYYFKKNEERGAARNYGIKRAKGKYITFLDSDDLLYPDHFEEAFNFIQKQNPIIFHQQYELKDGNERKIVKINTSIKKALVKGNPLSCMGVFIEREIALKNLFIEDRRISGSEDYELWLRYAAKYPFLNNPICTASLCLHEDRSVYKIEIDELINRKLLMLEYSFNNEEVRKVYLKYSQQMYAYAYSYIALHIALTKKNKADSIKYLIKSITQYPKGIIEKRIFAILKHLVS